MHQKDIHGSLDFENITPTEGLKESIRIAVSVWWRTQAHQRSLYPKSYEIWFSRQLTQNLVVCEMRVYGEGGDFWEGMAVEKNARRALDSCLSSLIYFQYNQDGTYAYVQEYRSVHR